MKTYNFASPNYIETGHTASYYITDNGDIVDSLSEMDPEFEVCVAKVVIDGFYVGSLDEMKRSALRKYQEAIK